MTEKKQDKEKLQSAFASLNDNDLNFPHQKEL